MGKNLIKGVTLKTTTEEISEIIQGNEMLYLVLDGGQDNGPGYYGWVIATKEQIVIEHKGHAPGNKRLIKSLRTESVGVLSMACLYKDTVSFMGSE